MRLLCIANCGARAGEIFDEHVAHDTAMLIHRMGRDVVEAARTAAEGLPRPFAPNSAGAEPRRLPGQGKPARPAIPDAADDLRGFVTAAFQRIWNGRDFAAMADVYDAGVEVEMPTGRAHHDPGQLRSHVMSVVAMFPDLAMRVGDLRWMGNAEDGHLVSIRWGAVGTHRGHGPYGPPTGREVHLRGITRWHVERTAAGMRVRREWTAVSELGILTQLCGPEGARGARDDDRDRTAAPSASSAPSAPTTSATRPRSTGWAGR